MTNKEPDIIKIADIFWAFHNARLADPSLREMKPYVEPILQLINEARVDENQRYLDQLDTYIDKSRQPQAISFGSASGAIQNAGWKRVWTDRIAHLKSTKWYGWFWPPERRKIKIMQALYDYNAPEIEKRVREAWRDSLLYGVPMPHIKSNPNKESNDE